MRTRIAVLAGGYSAEAAVSLKSAAMVMNNIDRERYNPLLITIAPSGWQAEKDHKTYPVNRADLSVELPDETFNPDLVFMMIHGTPGEDGRLQGYLETIGVPCTTGSVLNMSLTFNKALTTQMLRAMSFPTTTGVVLRKEAPLDLDAILDVTGLPCFVKPNRGGSSIGMSKVKTREELLPAIERAFEEDTQVVVEQFITGTEVTCGVIPYEGGILALPVTEIVSENEFFDYAAKYLGQSQEITPARISDALFEQVQTLAKLIYQAFECKGMARVDMIISNDQPHVIEINTVPGFTEASIIPQQAAAAGISKKELIALVIEGCRG